MVPSKMYWTTFCAEKNLLVLLKLLKITINIINLIHCIYLLSWQYVINFRIIGIHVRKPVDYLVTTSARRTRRTLTRIILRPLSALNLKGEKRRNVGKLNNELNIVNQLVDHHFLLFVNITGNWKNRLAHTRQIIIADWLSLSESSWHVFITRRVQALIQR
jgi:hypothetical protein